jgi:putative DNA primase/helicase
MNNLTTVPAAHNFTKEQLEAMLANTVPTKVTFPVLGARGVPLMVDANYQALFDFYGVTIRYNEMSKDVEIEVPGIDFSDDTKSNALNATLRGFCYKEELGVTALDDTIGKFANLNSYHPVRDWLDNTEWDGVDRLPEYYNSVVLRGENPMKETMMRKWVLSAIAAVYHPNFSCEGVLTFQGEQGIGKTISVENIIPPMFHNIWNKDACVIDMKAKDTVLKPLGYWISELGELDATFKKSDIEALKGWLTEKFDKIRLPYDRKPNNYSRRTVFYATVNELEFLQDAQNRRFWVLAVEKFLPITMDHKQFWAQIKAMYDALKGKIETAALREQNQEWGWFMSPEERTRMSVLQEEHKTIDPIEEMMQTHCVAVSKIKNGSYMNVTEILTKILDGGRISRKDANTGAKWLLKNKYTRLTSDKKFYVELQGLKSDLFAGKSNVDTTLAERMDKLRKK